MKISEIFAQDEYLHAVIFDAGKFHSCCYKNPEEFDLRVRSIARRANSQEEFIELFLADPTLGRTSEAACILKRAAKDRLWKTIREEFGDDCRKTISDAGGLKIGNGAFSVIIPNGRGDGTTRYAVLDNKKAAFVSQLMDFFTSVSGEINIYDYDCGDTVEERISGRYGIYVHDGLILLESWDK